MIVNTSCRGRTSGGRYAYRPIVELEPDDYPPDSNFWAGRARYELSILRESLGDERYQEWVDECITDQDVWKDLATKAATATADLIPSYQEA